MSTALSPSGRRRGLRALVAATLLAGTLAAIAPASDAAPVTHAVSTGLVDGTDLGPNVYLFTPSMAQSDIQATVDRIAAQQLTNQFGTQRYQLLFAPGTYGTAANPLVFQVGYYTDVAGLGASPSDVVINGSIDVYNQCDETGNCLALNNFWRSVSDLTINVAGGSGCHANTEFWAVSQAASMRRVVVNGGLSFMDYCTNPAFASGGFVADSSFSGSATNGSQQQFMVRNSALGGWSNGVWNQVFVGTSGAPAEQFGPGSNQYTTVANTPVEAEKPYLYLDTARGLSVFVPSATANTTGPSWQGHQTPGTSLPISSFFVATPSSTVKQLNDALHSGKNLLLTPGVYALSAPLRITHPNTVVLGLGLATLVPTTGKAAIDVDGIPGVELSDLILDAGPTKSNTLLYMHYSLHVVAKSPSTLHDVYFRVGGATPGKVATAATIETTNVVIDNLWAWRADHGAGVGWTSNTATTGLRITGADVTAYGLFVEHFQGDEIVWNNTGGRLYMLQNEMPYDVPSQGSWMSSPTVKGYPALRIGRDGGGFRGYGLGSYSFFNQGLDIHATQAFTIAKGVDASVHDALTVFLDGSGGIDSVIDGRGGPVTIANSGTPSDVVG